MSKVCINEFTIFCRIVLIKLFCFHSYLFSARKACIDRVEREAKLGLAVYLELLVGLAGECSAKSVDALVQQRLALCNLRAKKPTK